jgi:hypothetical protein
MVVEVVALRRAPAIFPVGESNEDRLVTACGTKCGCRLVLQGFRRRRFIDRRHHFDQALLHCDFDAEATELALRVDIAFPK